MNRSPGKSCTGRGLGFVAAAGAFGMALLVGCASAELRTTPLTPSRTPLVKDVPVPMHFELVDRLSEDYAAPGWRLLRHSYFGQAAPHVVRQFYREQMPKSGWEFVSGRNVQGKYYLLFRKPGELAEVQIAQDSRDFKAGTLVTVIVKPVATTTGKP